MVNGLAPGLLGLTGLGLGAGVGAAAGSASTAARLVALAAGCCAAGAGGAGWSTRRAHARNRARADRLLATAQAHEAVLQSQLEAAERAVSELSGETVLSTRQPEEGEVLIDPLTGLYSESYLLVALDARIAAARRRLRPVSVVMLEVVVGIVAGSPTPADPQLVATAIRSTLREADTASRTQEGRYVLVLEDTAENGAIWSVERLRSRLVGEHPDHTVWAGVACYPAHAFNLDEVLHQAGVALEAAKEWRQDRIEVATAD